jgi:hypothetical protein
LGLVAFYLVNYPINDAIDGGVNLEYQISVPLAVSLVLYLVIGFVKPEDTPERDAVLASLNSDDEGPGSASAALPVPEQDAGGRRSVAGATD